VVSALRNKRAELAEMVSQLEQQLARQRTRSAWFRQGECLWRLHDELRNAVQPLTTRDLVERIMRAKAVFVSERDATTGNMASKLIWS
jgi:hypothetical protein